MKFCLTISNPKSFKLITSLDKDFIFELRLDKLDIPIEEYQHLFKINNNIIVTCRENENQSTKNRFLILENAINSGAGFIDLDIKTDYEFLKDLVELANKKGCKLIISYHDYTRTPDLEYLYNIAQKANDYNPYIIKIATLVTQDVDLKKLSSLYSRHDNIVAMGMGELGKKSRLIALLLDSPIIFTYYYKHDKVVEGQISFRQLSKFAKLLRDI